MKRIKLYAYFAGNLGDDLMVGLLRQRYPEVRFYSETWQEVPGIVTWESLQRKHGRLNRLLNILTGDRWKDFYMDTVRKHYNRKCVCSVYIGGSIYMQRTAPETQVAQEERKLCNGPLFVIGANFGPCRDGDFPKVFEGYFRRCAGVTFRERASFERFRDCGNVNYAPDVVLNLRALPRQGEGTVLVSVIDLENRAGLRQYRETYESWMAALCEACVQRGKQPVLLSFCKAEGDEKAVFRILERLSPELRRQTGYLNYRGDPAEILEAYARAERIISTRFHALILALCYEKPVFSVAYSEKCQNYLKDLKFQGFCGISELAHIAPAEALGRCGLPEGLAEHKQGAENQFAQLDGFCKQAL